MKKFILTHFTASIVLATAFVWLPIATITLTGCQTTTERRAYTTLAVLEQSAVTAYDGYVKAVIRGDVPADNLAKVSQRFNEFQAAMQVALTAAQYNVNAFAPENVQVLSQDLLNLIATLQPKK